ncbi:MAG: glycerophosphodiester phosphodiesterase [Candidatus Thermoplasmatota archaeon]|nr:glycerophosphodiester phosphodiesterase [Candidatus Thermoplasmatota archaeon]
MRWRAAIIALLLILPLSAGGDELEGMEIYFDFGNLRSHTSTSYSDGEGTPEEAFARSYGLNSVDIIAHRGASGYLPEHTLEAYDAAYFMGSDYIEQDLVMTRDGVPICLHDIYLEPTTNVEEVFPERCRNDGRWYAADFTLEEIKRLKVHERAVNSKPVFPDRFPYGFSDFEVPTFEEAIQLIQGLNKSARRNVGIYPEIKHPEWHRENGLPMEENVVEILKKYGYDSREDKVYLQCFEDGALQRIRKQSSLKLVRLIGLDERADEKKMESFAEFVEGIGVQKELIALQPEMVSLAHNYGLEVHVWTFRYESSEEIKNFVSSYDIDGLFTDFPDRTYYALNS